MAAAVTVGRAGRARLGCRRGRPFDNRVTLISLRAGLTSRVVLGHLTDPSLDIPTTATVAAGRLCAVSLRFTTPREPTTPYWITQLPLRP